MKKIEINFNQNSYNNKINELNNIAKALTDAVELSKDMTKGEVRTTNSKDLNNWLQIKTGFPNNQSNATLLNVGDEYKSFLGLETIYKGVDLSLFDECKNIYKPNANALDTLKAESTLYLRDSKIETYKSLKRVTDILNKLSGNPIRYININYSGEASINLSLLENSDYI